MKKTLFLALFGLTFFSQMYASQSEQPVANIPFVPLAIIQTSDDESLANIVNIDKKTYEELFKTFIKIQVILKERKLPLSDGLRELKELKELSQTWLADKESQEQFAIPLAKVMDWYQNN